MFQGFFNALGIKAHDELAIDLEGRYTHDPVGHQDFPGIGVLSNVAFLIGDVLF